jgi:hypothetical protein
MDLYLVKLKRNRDKVFIIGFIILATFSFLGLSGTLNSGYHFQDDHEIVRIENDLRNGSFYDVSKKWVVEDLHIRFRPLYFIHRIATIRLFGSDFLALSLYTACLGIATFLFFFLVLRNLKFSILESFLFLIISFIGPQLSIWWRLGPNETIGVTLLSIAFWFMSSCLNKKHYLLNNILFVFFLILTSLCKESFLIIVPGVILFKILNEKLNFRISTKEVIRMNMISILPLIIVMVELTIIISYVGTNKVGYAGLDSSLKTTLVGMTEVFRNLWKPYIYILIIAFVILISSQLFILKHIQLKQLIVPFALFILLVIPNVILYAKSGMWERYYIPASIGFSFLIVSIIRAFGDQMKILKVTIFVFVLITYFPILKAANNSARSFAHDGEMIKSLITNIVINHSSGSDALIVVDPVKYYEQSYSLKVFLKYVHNIDLFGVAIVNDSEENFSKNLIRGWYSYFEIWEFNNQKLKPDEIIFLDKTLMENFFSDGKLKISDYRDLLSENPVYAVLVNRNDQID